MTVQNSYTTAVSRVHERQAALTGRRGGPGAAVGRILAVALFLAALSPTALSPVASAESVPAGIVPAADGDVPGRALGPIAVIGRGDLERSGLQSLGDLFGDRTAYNAFGLYRAYNLGTVLVDGRRAEGLDTLPLSAVERIEIFAPGARPFESGGAGAGTANIVLRRDVEGAEVRGSGALPTAKGGDSGHLPALWGGKVGHAHVTVGAEHLRRGGVRWADRDYSRSAWTEGGAFADASGVSIAGNTLLIDTGDGIVARPLGDCDGSGYTGILANPGGLPGTGCGFSYADIGWETSRQERQGVFATLDLPLDKTATVYAVARFVQKDTLLRWAPYRAIQGMPLQQDGARHGLQTRPGGTEQLAPPRRTQPVAQADRRRKVHRRNRSRQATTSSRRLTQTVTKIRL